MHTRIGSHLRLFSAALLVLACLAQAVVFVNAQTETTGAFRGRVVDESGGPLPDATVRATNKLTGVPTATRTTADGYFTIGLLQPGDYTLTVLKGDMYDVRTRDQRLTAVDATTVLPEPFMLRRRTAGTVATQPTPQTTGTPDPTASPTPDTTAQTPTTLSDDEGADVAIDINTRNPRRGGIFTREEVSTLPLGATTLTRSFDELALLLPGVATAPQTLGSIAGPGVGPGVGSAGQFAVNGMRSRSNNFTVDGSDNNDEDIGVRRQGFLALVPQPIESIQEYQVTTLLAPAQYGRNLGAQVNAVSKSGGNDLHGTIYGFLNSSRLNARNPFDTINGDAVSRLFAGTNQPVVLDCPNPCNAAQIAASQIRVQNFSGGEDSFTLAQGGLVLGGKLVPDKLFFFISAEGQNMNATKEASFAVPTVEQRGAFNSGATGIFRDPFAGTVAFAFPTTLDADAIYSLFPFPNNPNGIYGRNTFTNILPANGQGKILSGKVDGNWKWRGRQQSFTARYNFTEDYRDIPVTGEALFSTLRPRVRTQNFSTFLNSQLSGLDSTRPVFNQLRASYGRTRLNFDEYRDPTFQRPSAIFPNEPFLLNSRYIINNTLPDLIFDQFGNLIDINRNTGPVFYGTDTGTVEEWLGPIGQVRIAGLSPIGVDVNNFPQRRVNNTYQVADTMTVRIGNHNFAFGTDIRRTELNSDLPRLARPLITFNGAPRLTFSQAQGFGFNGFINPLDLVAAGAASGFIQTLTAPGASTAINLRYYQYNFFGQDEWRVTENFVLSYGLRYEYNTPPRETSRRIESTFNSPLIAQQVPGLANFIAGRTGIFDADKNNFAPRVGFAYSPEIFGSDRTTVIRGGYGMFYDQILGAVVSQSRNVFPNALTINLAGGFGGIDPSIPFDLFNPNFFFARPGTLNQFDPAFTTAQVIQFLRDFGLGVNAVGVTLPERRLKTPMAHHYSLSFEQQLSRSLVMSAAYVGTQGRNLLRLTTPNLGPNAILLPLESTTSLLGQGSFVPGFFGFVLTPGTRITPGGLITGGRPSPSGGPVEIYKSTSRSRYDSLQLQLRGRFGFLGSSSQFQAQYTFAKSRDDASDVFDLAGAPALPQDSLTEAGEYAPSNFDVRHRFSYNYISDLSDWGKGNGFLHFIFNGLQVAGTGIFQTGQPFTVNSIFDVNLDGNLTDRPNTLTGIRATGNRARPYEIAVANATSLLAPVGQNGAVPRNALRGSNLWLTNSAIIKNFRISEDKALSFRMDVFNVFNRANYGIPVRYLETPWFGRATDTVTPGRRIQFGIKYSF